MSAERERELIARMLVIEAERCIADIVPGDEIGRREANARASALLTAVDDIRALEHHMPDAWPDPVCQESGSTEPKE